ncbi:hypothetical protein C922_05775 [Plasmodium inui San Antonio 1]|uniref:Uncharacterized protein n=1 Tax=Plasmodium inui San Antonio 1 TaxID=1237626 RepID=W6ZX17_9APIC|nr:hypothetical protein C922_05775 [Plasmodium inui San Antonio 1]EUD63843.1 hypothetical protein C922_05775 [Plasmodium inui San Antonio 1]
MERLGLTELGRSWSHKPASQHPNQCQIERHKYCLGVYGSSKGAEGGFLGRAARGLTKRVGSINWQQFSGEGSPLKKYVLGQASDEYTWAGLLGCVISEALSLETISTTDGGNELLLWKKENWRAILRDGVTKTWSKSSVGQNIIMAAACIIAALMNNQQASATDLRDIKSVCHGVWETVAIELQAAQSQKQNKDLKALEEFLLEMRELDGDESSKYYSLGFLLSIFFGLTKCCKYNRNYGLKGLIRTSGWGLRQIGACQLHGTQFSCKGSTMGSSEPRLNLWTTGGQKLVKDQLRESPKTLKITDAETGKELPEYEPTRAPLKGQNPEIDRIVTMMQSKDPNQGIIATKGSAGSLTSANLQGPFKKEEAIRNSPEALPRPRPREDEKVSGLSSSPATQEEAQIPRDGNRSNDRNSTSESSSSEESFSEEIGQDLLVATAPAPKLRVDNSVGAPKDTGGSAEPERNVSGSMNIGEVVGGVLALVLGMGSIYGLYRIIRRRRKPEGGRLIHRSRIANPIRYTPTEGSS